VIYNNDIKVVEAVGILELLKHDLMADLRE
jgi:hypothetical protein